MDGIKTFSLQHYLFLTLEPVCPSLWSEPALLKLQDKIFRRKRLSTGANLVHAYIGIWGKGILKFNKFSM